VDACGPRAPKPYFDLTTELRRAAGDRPVDEVVRQALADSVRHHLIADVPVGVFLSAGLDSTALALLAAEQVSSLHAVTLGFREYEGKLADEVPAARTTAARLGLKHHVEHADFEAQCSDLLATMDQPSIDGVNTYFGKTLGLARVPLAGRAFRKLSAPLISRFVSPK
jgi:asparagine synthase (glutamine-hydrolysing)